MTFPPALQALRQCFETLHLQITLNPMLEYICYRHPKYKGQLHIVFKNGLLASLSLDWPEGLTEKQEQALRSGLPFRPAQTDAFEMLGFIRQEPEPVTETADKIALFCNFYEAKYGIKYKAKRAEAGMVREVAVSAKLLKAYFESNEWWAGTKSIAFYCKNINAIRERAEGIAPAKPAAGSKFPNEWSEKVEASLTSKEKQEYWAHLRAIGWKAIRETQPGSGTSTKWVPPA